MWVLQEIWTLCRIFKRNVSHKKHPLNWGELSAKHKPINPRALKTFNEDSKNWKVYDMISFGASAALDDHEKKPAVAHSVDGRNQSHMGSERESSSTIALSEEAREFFANGNCWDEIVTSMEFCLDPYHL